jgi:hypothetical protein|tara:strand:+ start:336 stop:524 length:189 start_codon:yes stop_codon:yes gene_type:complete
MADSLKSVLMQRDQLTSDEADDQIQDAQRQFDLYLEDGNLTGAEQICAEYFGLEPDYVIEFL